jgi:hypothetical protein
MSVRKFTDVQLAVWKWYLDFDREPQEHVKGTNIVFLEKSND